MKKVILTLKGAIVGEFVGIEYNTEKDIYEVWGASIHTYSTLNGAKKRLSRNFKYEDTTKYNKISESVYELIVKEEEDIEDIEISEELGWELVGIMSNVPG